MYLNPWHLLVIATAGGMNQEQSAVIEYLEEENRVLRELLGKKRPRLNDDQRRRLAVKGKALGRKLLSTCCCIVTPDTILRWYRMLIAKKWDFSKKRGPGRPRVQEDIARLTVRMAQENPSWDYTTIRGALFNLGHTVARETVRNILKEHGIVPDAFDGFLLDVRYLILDRDTIYTEAFWNLLKQVGSKVVRLPPRSPNLNAYAERFVRTIKEGCLDRMIFFGERSFRNTIREFLEHYHHERNHQGLENRLIDPPHGIGSLEGKVVCRERLGGVLRYYHRKAA